MKTALLLIAHGSREPGANADLLHVVDALRQRGDFDLVEACYLELAEPDIDSGAARCIAQGGTQIILLPYFLSAGIHVRRDLTAAQQRLAERFPHADMRLADPLGRHPLLVEIVAERAAAARG